MGANPNAKSRTPPPSEVPAPILNAKPNEQSGRATTAPRLNGDSPAPTVSDAHTSSGGPGEEGDHPSAEIHAEPDPLLLTIRTLAYAMFPGIGRKFLEERAAGKLRPEELLPAPGAQQAAPATSLAPTDFNVTVHGETYHIKITGAGHRAAERRPFYVTLDGVPEEILVETLSEIVPTEAGVVNGERATKASRRPRASKEGHVTSSMPGSIVDVLVKPGDKVKAGDPVLVIEAMKMENEIPAPIAGAVKAVNVGKGDSVNPDEALVEIAPGAVLTPGNIKIAWH